MRFASFGGLALLISTACGGANTAAEAKPPVAVTEVSLEAEAERPEAEEPAADEERSAAIEAARNAGVLGVLSSEQGEAFAALLGTSSLQSEGAFMPGGEIGDGSGVGGLGLRGVGVGGGGTGEVIGLGTIGTIGTGGGAGTGSGMGRGAGFSGYGSGRARSGPAPQVKLGIPAVQGKLDPEIVRRILRRHLAAVRYCYEKEQVKSPQLAGEVRLAFTIGAGGEVAAVSLASSTLQNSAVESCVLARVKTMAFPQPESGVVLVDVAMDFSTPPAPPTPPAALPTPPAAPPASSGAGP